jgi:hypothetical protein
MVKLEERKGGKKGLVRKEKEKGRICENKEGMREWEKNWCRGLKNGVKKTFV